MRNLKLLTTLALLGSFSVTAQLAPKYSNEFLSIGVDARALSMGGAYVAGVDDVGGAYWNPSALLEVKSDMQLNIMHAEYFAGIAKYDYFSLAKPLDDKSAIGLSLIRFGVDDIPNTSELIDNNGDIDYDRITSFSAADYAFIGSYARDLGIEGLSTGANVKIIHRKVGSFGRSWGFGFDVGAKYQLKGWTLGANFRDVTSTFNAWRFNLTESITEAFIETENELPENGLELTLPKLATGITKRLIIKEKFSVQPEFDLDFTFDGKRNVLIRTNAFSIDPKLGTEMGFKDIVFLRFGFNNLQQVEDFNAETSWKVQPNLGLGIQLNRLSLNYALTNISSGVGLYSNIFSIRFDINKVQTE